MSKAVVAIAAGVAISLLCAQADASGKRGVSVTLRESEQKGAAVVEEIQLYANSYALVIGNDAYDQGWPRLSMAVKDAKAVAQALSDKGFDVSLKLDLDAAQLRNALEEFYLIRGENPEARLFVWFAGHGYSRGGEGFLIPTDAPKPEAGGQFYRKALSLRRIGEYVRLATAKHAFAVFDSCFSGTVFDSARALPPTAVTRATTLPVRQFLTSGDAGQTVSDNGAFRELFLRALAGEENADANGDGYLTASELGLFLTDRVTNLTQSKQTPRYGKLRDRDWDRGDFVFVSAARRNQAAAADPKSPPGAAQRGTAEAAKIQQESLFWESIRDSGDANAYNAYLKAFPEGAFAPLAHVKLTALKAASKGSQADARARPSARTASAAATSAPHPVAMAAAEYLPLPTGTAVEYDDGWQFRVTGVEDFQTETRSKDNQYRFIYAGAVVFGEIGFSQYTCSHYSCQGLQPDIELDSGKQALRDLWPLAVGKSAEFRLTNSYPPYVGDIFIIDDPWTVRVTVDRTERVRVGEQLLSTFVFKSVGTTKSGRRFDQTHWYDPASGLIVKLERKWSGKETENSLSSTMPGEVQRFQLRNAVFPPGARNAWKQ